MTFKDRYEDEEEKFEAELDAYFEPASTLYERKTRKLANRRYKGQAEHEYITEK